MRILFLLEAGSDETVATVPLVVTSSLWVRLCLLSSCQAALLSTVQTDAQSGPPMLKVAAILGSAT
jgi:hypothetical protein